MEATRTSLIEAEWLPGWMPVALRLDASLMASCREKCEVMIKVGRELFRRGVMPEFSDIVNVPQSHRDGTGGNFAIRHGSGFLVTGCHAHKGRLGTTDFALVELVLWDAREIWFYHLGDKMPSTDSLLVAMVLEMNPAVNAWVHCHCAVDTPYSLKLNYPSVKPADWLALRAMLESDARVINMIDHDLAKTPNGKPDSVIILGKDMAEAGALALNLIR